MRTLGIDDHSCFLILNLSTLGSFARMIGSPRQAPLRNSHTWPVITTEALPRLLVSCYMPSDQQSTPSNTLQPISLIASCTYESTTPHPLLPCTKPYPITTSTSSTFGKESFSPSHLNLIAIHFFIYLLFIFLTSM